MVYYLHRKVVVVLNILFATDLDGTLISEQKSDILALETSHGKSYISKENLELLMEIEKYADVIPLTTRSEGSYSKFDIGISFKYALIENGGLLLIDGEKDVRWKKNSLAILEESKDSERVCRQYLEKNGFVRKSNSMFVVDYISKGMSMDETVKHHKELTELVKDFRPTIHCPGQIFAVYDKFCKGESLKRFLKEHHYDIVITCGDSSADYSMLKGNISIGLNESPAKYKFPKIIHKEDNHAFTNFALKTVLSIIK